MIDLKLASESQKSRLLAVVRQFAFKCFGGVALMLAQIGGGGMKGGWDAGGMVALTSYQRFIWDHFGLKGDGKSLYKLPTGPNVLLRTLEKHRPSLNDCL